MSANIAASLESAANKLPIQLDGDAPVNCQDGFNGPYQITPVLRMWVMCLPLRAQGVLVTALRGCDGAPKEDTSKVISRMIRRAILNPADNRETIFSGGFFGFQADKLLRDAHDFLHSMDQYPHHYLTHLMHACEVIGYEHPDPVFKQFFTAFYYMMAYKMHLTPECSEEMRKRLTFDRVAAGTVERDFTE